MFGDDGVKIKRGVVGVLRTRCDVSLKNIGGQHGGRADLVFLNSSFAFIYDSDGSCKCLSSYRRQGRGSGILKQGGV